MYQPLAPCPGCARHVRVREPACPFCATALSGDLTPQGPAEPAGRLARSALAALATAVLGAACARETPAAPPPPAPSSGGDVVQGPVGTPSTDAVPPPRVVPVADAGTGPDDDGAVVAEYGAPARPRADAGVNDPGAAVAAYGAAPPPIVTPPPDHGTIRPLYGVPPRP